MFRNVLPDYSRMLKYYAFNEVFDDVIEQVKLGDSCKSVMSIIRHAETRLLEKHRIPPCNDRDTIGTLVMKKMYLEQVQKFHSYVSLASNLFCKCLDGNVITQGILDRMNECVTDVLAELLNRCEFRTESVHELSLVDIESRVEEVMRKAPKGLFVGYHLCYVNKAIHVNVVGATKADCLYLGEEIMPGYMEHYTEIDYPLLVRVGDKSDFKHIAVSP